MSGGKTAAGAGPALLATARQELERIDPDLLDDDARLELLRSLEDLTRQAAGLGARIQVAFATSQVARQKADGVPQRRRGRAVADDLATARKTSPYWSSRELTSARALVEEMPCTLRALETGTINAYQARLVTEATTGLDAEDRAEVDSRLEGALAGASSAEIGSAVRALVYQIDPAGFVERARRAAKDRGVSVRPAPDVMATLSARLPAPMAIACYKALREHAVAARASGDPRSLNQLMADELVARLTGRTVVDGIDVEVGLIMTDACLFGGDSDAADLDGYGPIPAEMARDLLRTATGEHTDHAASADDDNSDKDARAGAAPEAGSGGAPEAGAGAAPGAGADAAPEAGAGAAPGAGAAAGPGAGAAAAETETCPDGIRCASWDCTKLHGTPAATTPTPSPAAGAAPPAATDSSAPSSGSSAPSPGSPAPSPASPAPAPASPALAPGSPASASGSGSSAGVRAAKAWVRRLYTDPLTGTLTDRDSRRRVFTGSVRAFVIARDRTCRNSWCGAPIRDIDHITRYRDGGTTDPDNGRGLCQRCNLARERARHRDPAPDTYRPPPPLIPTLIGRQDPGGQARGPDTGLDTATAEDVDASRRDVA